MLSKRAALTRLVEREIRRVSLFISRSHVCLDDEEATEERVRPYKQAAHRLARTIKQSGLTPG